MSPTELPPYTRVCPARAIQAPRLRAASSKCGLSPKFDPQYTVMFMALSSAVGLICSEKVLKHSTTLAREQIDPRVRTA